MNQPNDAYTIVIFRGATAKPLRFSFPRAIVRRAVILGALLIVAELALLSQYVIQTGEVWELQAIRQELLNARERTSEFSMALEDLKRRVLAMKEVNEKLRVMLGIESLKPEDYLNGQGGEETPVVEGDGLNVGTDGRGPAEGSGEGMAEKSDPKAANETRGLEQSLVDKVQQKIVWLQNEAVYQERTLDELTEAAKERSARWASTPSVWPVKGWVTSGFGLRISPFTGQRAVHDGLDIGAPPSAPVYAPAGGQVAASGFDAKMGNLVAIDHGYGFETQYGHLSKVLVKQGQRVKRGDVIGLVGSTGLSTGPHLHYMVKVNSRPVNPQRYILD
jgi:murein DD-endopeptidase MepM/ murein hydrolase activator NlpD